MEIKELRVGNYVQHITNGKVRKVDLSDYFDEYDTGQAFFHMKPIPLTPEILVKMGFEEEHTLLDGTIVFKGKPYTYFKNGEITFPFYTAVIQYVHQLQNALYVITGTELEFTL